MRRAEKPGPTQMIHSSISSFAAQARRTPLGRGPFAIVIAEDRTELTTTLDHLTHLGFRRLFLVAPDDVDLPDDIDDASIVEVIRHPTRQPGTAAAIVNALIKLVPGEWIHYCYNAEYLFFPFCEQRRIGEAIAFVMEERRNVVPTFVIDLYAEDLTRYTDAVSLETAHLDSSGYYAETRRNADDEVLDRQLNFYGGLRWRFEEHVPAPKRRIDRSSLFQAMPGLTLNDDHTLSDPEMNTYTCPWHHSMSATVCSFRVAKALRSNPGSRHDVDSFRWHKSTRFFWSSQQLMELGLMEPGQWF
jgi:hypothetical protein